MHDEEVFAFVPARRVMMCDTVYSDITSAATGNA